jgi:pimeloyl-ACP methyl ester carboxylesterase
MKYDLLSLCVIVFACAALTARANDASTVERRVVSRDNIDIEVLSQGTGPVLVLLPSLGRSGEDYEAVAAMLVSQGFRVVRPQPRGIGRSKRPMDGLNMHDLAADVASAIENENKGAVIVVGHAFGNFVARQVAADRPDLVRGVVVAAASSGKVPPGSAEKPIGPEMRQAIDGPSDMSLPESNGWNICGSRFLHLATIRRSGSADGIPRCTTWKRTRASILRSMITFRPARRPSWTFKRSKIRWRLAVFQASSNHCWAIG